MALFVWRYECEEKGTFKEFLQYVSLNVCGLIGLSCYILADTFFVAGGLGADGLTALNLAIPVYSFVHGCGLMLGMGGATKYSILRGQGEERRGNMVFSNALCAAVVLASAFMLAGICFAGQLARTLGADGEVYGMTKTYLKVILLFAPAFMANDILSCFVRNDGSPKLSMILLSACPGQGLQFLQGTYPAAMTSSLDMVVSSRLESFMVFTLRQSG